MVTMAMIDAARGQVYDADTQSGALAAVRQDDDQYGAVRAGRVARLAAAREEVERLLREWWKQGCREPMKGGFAEYETKVLSIIDRAERAEARAKEACDALQDAIDRAREACAAPPTAELSAGDWIDELIGLLRVTRGQRDDAEARWQKEVLELRAEKAKPDLKPVAQEFLRNYSLEDVEITRRILARADHLLKKPRCACGLHELPPAGYVDDDLGHHKAKRCNLSFLDRPGYVPMFRIVRLDPATMRPKEPPPSDVQRCRDCRDWHPAQPGERAVCGLYDRNRNGLDPACHRFAAKED